MVNYKTPSLDATFRALADPTRRKVVGMLMAQEECRIIDLARPFNISLAGFSKHIKLLEEAELVIRSKRGRENFLQLNTEPLDKARDWLAYYEQFWTEKLSSLDGLLARDTPSIDTPLEYRSPRRKK
jgi:DNA-binding transcriptional ArsR family regulator